MKELVLGSGPRGATKKIFEPNRPYENPVTLDLMASNKPDVVHDLNNTDLPFQDEEFDEIHAYEILEHVGRQGDWQFFFDQFNEFYRILKPGGRIFITVPQETSVWAWGDPGHTRVLPKEVFSYLDKDNYGTGDARTDYSAYLDGSLKLIHVESYAGGHQWAIALEKVNADGGGN